MGSKTQSEHYSIVNIDTTTNDNDNGCSTKQMRFTLRKRIGNDSNGSWDLEQKICEIIMQQQGNQSYNLMPSKFHKSLKEFTNAILNDQKRQQYSSFRHQEMESINIINKGNKTRVKNEIADALSRISRAGDHKLKEKIFQQKCRQLNLNPTIDLFSQHFNNLLPSFMSTIGGHGEIAINALNQQQKKEFSWIHPPNPLLQAVLKKIREEQIEAMIIAPLWPGQIWYSELVNENIQSLILGQRNVIQESGTLLIKNSLKLPPGKIYCFLMDRRPEKEEDSYKRF
ncbi:MAG: hypothetical protein EZS28_007504 [Streblomastix strix]|uniref:Uncharacterized protein n=1 Tax=Streblomastix strix TaxID=222440 RepID=A0A5J4WPT4_9EUKA|nr:MAG: hypothetical protein EZS28_007504 [Streblomastix strix]